MIALLLFSSLAVFMARSVVGRALLSRVGFPPAIVMPTQVLYETHPGSMLLLLYFRLLLIMLPDYLLNGLLESRPTRGNQASNVLFYLTGLEDVHSIRSIKRMPGKHNRT